MNSNNILSKAKNILSQVNDFSSFESKYFEHIRLQGERTIDVAIFVFDIEKDYKLVVYFADAGFENFSIIHNSIDEELLNYI